MKKPAKTLKMLKRTDSDEGEGGGGVNGGDNGAQTKNGDIRGVGSEQWRFSAKKNEMLLSAVGEKN